MAATITITASAHSAIISATGEAAPRETCGLLHGSHQHIQTALVAANIHPDPTRHFEIDPAALIAAHKAARAGGPPVIGYFHSHPNGLARPSATDAFSAARDGRVWAIVANGEVTLWCDGRSGFEPLSYRVVEG
ncbi:MAG: peptidase [Novosphingobium sp. 12-64-8]|nr:MAG: peptidase [Novosphingobium sp. 12-64-8]